MTNDQQIQAKLEAATSPGGRDEFGIYYERFDGGIWSDKSDEALWLPVIVGGMTQRSADEVYEDFAADARRSRPDPTGSPFRRPRVVRRTVTPWEIV